MIKIYLALIRTYFTHKNACYIRIKFTDEKIQQTPVFYFLYSCYLNYKNIIAELQNEES